MSGTDRYALRLVGSPVAANVIDANHRSARHVHEGATVRSGQTAAPFSVHALEGPKATPGRGVVGKGSADGYEHVMLSYTRRRLA